MTDKEIQHLRKHYPCIVQFGKELQSYDYYIDNQVIEAHLDEAPRDTLYKTEDGKWKCVRETAWTDERKEEYKKLLD